MQYQDYYKILGVARDATADDIKKAFRKMARKYHPDVSKEADAETRMKEVNEAYAVLSDPEKRAAYDRLGSQYRPGQDFRPPPDWTDGFEFTGGGTHFSDTDFSDFFSELFGRMNSQGPGRRPGQSGQMRGQDHHARVQLEVEDSFNGATRQITLQAPQQDAQGRVQLRERTLEVRIPKGVRAGQIIRLNGQGSPGFGGGPAGDLLLEVHFRPHSRFHVEGRDIHMNLPIAPWEAALGAVVEVNLPGGNLKVRVPAGVQSGRQLRVRGKGLPSAPPGDLLLNLKEVLPPADTEKARQAYENMARDLAFDPRKQ